MDILKTGLITALCCASCVIPPYGSPGSSAGRVDAPDDAAATVVYVKDTYGTSCDEAMLLTPKANCDPDMLIPVPADCDAGFELKPYGEAQRVYVILDRQ